MKIIVTGGAGFIGSAVIRELIFNSKHVVLNIDKLTYAGNLNSLIAVQDSPRYHFLKADICNSKIINKILTDFEPEVIMNLAAESHVDRSIDDPSPFIKTNIVGTFNLLESVRRYWVKLSNKQKSSFRFHHVSTDEVYGDLPGNDLFTETTPYAPSSPYSASKAGSDHLVRAWHRTYSLPIVISNCSNNYGPYHFPEKLIPHIILNALKGKTLSVYGKGSQIRDWLYVEDHARALVLIATKASVGETYNIGGDSQRQNIKVVESICELLEELYTHKSLNSGSYKNLIKFVKDRPGHDIRYAIDSNKIKNELGWEPNETFDSGLRKTVEWYLKNEHWWQQVLNGSYRLHRIGKSKGIK